MELVKYTYSRPNSISPPLSQSTWYGTLRNFTRIDTPLYQDNSFQKHIYTLTKDQRRLDTIQNEFSKAKSNVEQLRSEIHYSYITKKQLVTVYKRKKLKRELIKQAAIRIQKTIRGFLTRKKYTNELVGLQQKIMQIRLQGLEKTNKCFMLFLGKAPVLAAKRIQTSVRKLLFRLKIHKFRKYYDQLLQDRAEKIFSVIRKHLTVYSCQLKVELKKFEIHKQTRLFHIKRNLAILTVKKVYRENKWSFKVIKHRINKYKRKIRNAAVFENTQNTAVVNPAVPSQSSRDRISIEGSEIGQEPKSPDAKSPEPKNPDLKTPEIQQEDLSSSTSEEERIQQELFLKRMKQLRKDRIKFGKISHCIRPKPTPPSILPLLYEKDIVEGAATQFTYSAITRATASRISESRPQRHSPIPFKSKTPTPHIRFVSKRLDLKPVPLYKKETYSSKMSRWDAEVELDEQPKLSIRVRFNSTVQNYTFSQMQKRRIRPTKVEQDESVRPKTTLRPFKEFQKKVSDSRPYSMNSNVIEFRAPIAN